MATTAVRSPTRSSAPHAVAASTLAFVAASTLTVLWHELAHGAAAVALGYSPVVSLLTGLLLLAVVSARRPGWRPGWLLLAWLGLLGVETFAGYLLTVPSAVVLGVCALGLVGVLAVAWTAVGAFARLAPTAPQHPTDLRLLLRQGAVLPWALGVGVLIVVSLPVLDPFGPVAVATSGLFTPVAMGLTARRFASLGALVDAAVARRSAAPPWLLLALALAVVIAVAVDRSVLRPGLHL